MRYVRRFVKDPQSTFYDLGTYGDDYTRYDERFSIGIIIARIALNMAPNDPLPNQAATLRDALRDAQGLNCRGNLLRLLAVKLLDPVPHNRPTFQQCFHHISNWDDDKIHQFMVRFFNSISEQPVKAAAIAILNRFYNDLCGGHGRVWFDQQRLGPRAYNALIEATLAGWTNANVRQAHDGGRQFIVNYLRNSGCIGAYMIYRHREEHYFAEMFLIEGAFGALSRNYLNFWQTRFDKLVTIAFLTATELDLPSLESFREFFLIGDQQYFNSYRNHRVNGFPI